MKRILVAEDNPANQELLTEMLGHWGFEVLTASNGREAFAMVESQLPDLLLVDIQMPEVDGYSFLRQLRTDARFKNLRAIALTAFAMRGDREVVLQRGFDGYVTKPIDFQILRAEIQKALEAAGRQNSSR